MFIIEESVDCVKHTVFTCEDDLFTHLREFYGEEVAVELCENYECELDEFTTIYVKRV